MPKVTLETLGGLIRERRGSAGLRELASEIDVSSATLSRVENGHVPDLETFRKICRWLEIDPGEVLGMTARRSTGRPTAQVSFRKDRTVSAESAQHLATMILAAQRALVAQRELETE